ncbi:zeta toxin family protein [Pseudomonas graminis]|uniref:Zeta toxin domain-containing protein n=1 Tax=Pseudomonas graminis TaxID=158627 RepID=A0A1C2EFI7_9PSED|nr:zeta toxin family protein [Pseudomonas graminis]OCX25686.1 hypothetical protein BBI10_01380 [Pseudomonas graminis]
MTDTHYAYTPKELDAVFEAVVNTIFDVPKDIADDGQPAPKILVVAGVQGSGKTYMLNNTLLKIPGYGNYVHLYQEYFRELHPRYAEFADQDVTRRYKHTETFIWELCSRIFAYAHSNTFNIVMETALDTKAFATVISGQALAAYQFDVHLIGCKKDFVHLSTIRRAFNALEAGTLERFVDIATIETSIENAEVILNAFEEACMRVSGSTITLYERGFGELKDRKKICSSRCDRVDSLTPYVFTNEQGTEITLQEQVHRIERSEALPTPCSFASFIALIQAPVSGAEDRLEAWQEAYNALPRMRRFWQHVPPRLPETLWSYIKKYSE